MTYVLPEKLKDLNPYDPVTEDFRIHLDANESFCEVPENIRQEILNAVSNVARKLCEKAGAYYHVDPKLLTAGNGSDELISLVVPYFLDEGDTMLVAVPDFSMYWFYAPFHKIKVESLQKENSMKTSAEEILQRAKEKNAKLLILDEPTVGLDVIARDEVLNMLREYMEENESSSILISSHISSDLESLCDDFYMIHAGKIILHEDTDVLLSDYAVLKVSEEEYEKLDQQYLIKIREEAYGYRCLTNQKQFYMENYPDVVIENGKIDDLVVMMEEQV